MKKPQNHFELHHYQDRDYFGEIIGYQLIAVDRKKFITRSHMKVKRAHISAAGRIHGGAMMAFVDFACGSAVFASMQPSDRTATIEIKTHFFRQVFEGQVLEARASLHFRGNRVAVAECQILDRKSGEKVAVAIGTYNILTEKAPALSSRASLAVPKRRAPATRSKTRVHPKA